MIESTINDAVTLGGAEALLAGRYRVVKQLGQGGMGSVYLAEDTQLNNFKVAIKMLPAILVANNRALKQLKAEALVSMKLNHSNIVPLRGFEENNGNPFLVMDYIEGQTLDDLLAERKKLTEEESIRILSPVAAALDYAHGEGVVHRDVKPGNVMIRKDGHSFVLDFGIAREIQETMTRVTGKLSSGTLMYMSPEQLHGAVPKAAQDVYSFAAMAYECLAGAPPFSRGQVEYQIDHDAPAPLPGGTQLFVSVMSGLAKKPEDRPATCAAVLEGSVFSHKEHKERKEAGVSRPIATEAGVSPLSRSNDSQPGRAGAPRPPQGNNIVRVEHVECDGGKGKISWKKVVFGLVALGLALAVGGVWWASRSGEKEAKIPQKETEKPREEEVIPQKEMEIVPTRSERSVRCKVQLWEGGPYWACKNIGAEEPWESGYYFWWGDTVGYKRQGDAWMASDGSKSNFSFEVQNTPTYDKSIAVLQSEGWITADNVLAPEHDAAQVQWGDGWRMPTKQELDDLQTKCEWKWTKMNGVNGYVVRGRGKYASASIFLPCAGLGYGTSLYDAGSYGNYWSSVPDSGSRYAWDLYFDSGGHGTYDIGRYNGRSVRPLQGFTK